MSGAVIEDVAYVEACCQNIHHLIQEHDDETFLSLLMRQKKPNKLILHLVGFSVHLGEPVLFQLFNGMGI